MDLDGCGEATATRSLQEHPAVIVVELDDEQPFRIGTSGDDLPGISFAAVVDVAVIERIDSLRPDLRGAVAEIVATDVANGRRRASPERRDEGPRAVGLRSGLRLHLRPRSRKPSTTPRGRRRDRVQLRGRCGDGRRPAGTTAEPEPPSAWTDPRPAGPDSAANCGEMALDTPTERPDATNSRR